MEKILYLEKIQIIQEEVQFEWYLDLASLANWGQFLVQAGLERV